MAGIGVPEGLDWAAWGTACLLAWMAVWWATEAIPIPATSLLPLVVLPLIDAGTPRAVGGDYMHHIVVLLLGGFVIAMGIERWDLHKRIALNVVSHVGTAPRMLVLGFMIATALLSMWISNTATTLMMVPIAISAAAAIGGEQHRAFSVALLLGVCYAASIGGVATPIGTPTNLIAINWLQAEHPEAFPRIRARAEVSDEPMAFTPPARPSDIELGDQSLDGTEKLPEDQPEPKA